HDLVTGGRRQLGGFPGGCRRRRWQGGRSRRRVFRGSRAFWHQDFRQGILGGGGGAAHGTNRRCATMGRLGEGSYFPLRTVRTGELPSHGAPCKVCRNQTEPIIPRWRGKAREATSKSPARGADGARAEAWGFSEGIGGFASLGAPPEGAADGDGDGAGHRG